MACLLALRTSRDVLVLEERHTGAQWRFALREGRFSLAFTHSVMKTPVEECYRADPERGLVLETAVYQSYGVGLPFLPEEGELTVEDGVFTLRMDRTVGRLNMTLSAIPDHLLRVDDAQYELTELLGGGAHAVSLWTEQQRFWRFDTRQTLFVTNS